MKIKNIFFDFDGVIADSVNIKTEAFYQMYIEFGEVIAKKVVEHHKNHGGMSRFEKFKLYHKDFLDIDLSPYKVDKLAVSFSKLVKQGVIDSPEVFGVRGFLQKHYSKMKFWIISGTPTNEIREIVKEKNMDHYFIECFGSPEKKGKWVRDLMDKYCLKSEESLFIGDAKSDYDAAIKNGILFVLRETTEGIPLFKNINVPRFTIFPDFEAILEEL